MYPNDTFLSLQHFYSILIAEVIFQRGSSGEWNREYMTHHMTWDPFLSWLHEENTYPISPAVLGNIDRSHWGHSQNVQFDFLPTGELHTSFLLDSFHAH
jgi:hypothetical protein